MSPKLVDSEEHELALSAARRWGREAARCVVKAESGSPLATSWAVFAGIYAERAARAAREARPDLFPAEQEAA